MLAGEFPACSAARAIAAKVASFSSMVNVCGLPAVVVPVHTTAAGLSMGIQLIGRPRAEAQLLAVAAQLEAVR